MLVSSNLPFTLTLSGSARLVLRGPSGARSFASGVTNVTLGGVPCNISAVSDDGGWVIIDTPAALVLCGSAARDCGYVALVVANSPTDGSRGAALSCPICPGAVGGSVVPIATGSGSFALGTDPAAQGDLKTLLPLAPAALSSMGIYHSVSCAQTGLWTDPLSGACTDASNPLSYSCAYGGGSSCVTCPVGALCPGGSRLWPRVGYWSPRDASSSVTACAPPDPAVKCGGWDISAGAVRCGQPYLHGSYLCGACAAGYYPYGDGSCVTCPIVAGFWDRYRILIVLFAGVVGAACVIAAGLGVLVATIGGTISGVVRAASWTSSSGASPPCRPSRRPPRLCSVPPISPCGAFSWPRCAAG